jgi:aspartyl-tRNA(Asn)/glutamyl-tRNA(Gln) amidotransferase subunit B
LLGLVSAGRISGKMAKAFFERMFETGAAPHDLADQEGAQISDPDALRQLVDRVIVEQADVWHDLVAGDERKLTFLMGQIMKASRGKANPQEARRLLCQRIEEER